MAITSITLSNFKSFRHLDVELGEFATVVGANASGKSNFVEAFNFVRNIANFGLDNAVSLQGGVEYLRNVNIGAAQDLTLQFVDNTPVPILTRRPLQETQVRAYESVYRFVLSFGDGSGSFEVSEDQLVQRCEVGARGEPKTKAKRSQERGVITIWRQGGKLRVKSEIPGVPADDLYPSYLQGRSLAPDSLLLESPWVSQLMRPFGPPRMAGGISIYDFDPKLSKRATQITGKAELEEDGSNLAIVLKNIIADPRKKKRFSNLLRDLLPFVVDLEVERFADKSLLFKVRETYARDHYLPASLLSDGTINITALIIALYFEGERLTIIEEPERNIHPYLISRVVSMLREASRRKQIIITTHNAEVVKHAGLDSILLMSRDGDGFSTICRPRDRAEVATFLTNDIGLDELYVQDLLGV